MGNGAENIVGQVAKEANAPREYPISMESKWRSRLPRLPRFLSKNRFTLFGKRSSQFRTFGVVFALFGAIIILVSLNFETIGTYRNFGLGLVGVGWICIAYFSIKTRQIRELNIKESE